MHTKVAAERLHALLLLDAAACTAMGLLLTLGTRALAGLSAIPEALLFYAGLALFPIAGFMVLAARRFPVSRLAVGAVIAGNAAWVMASAVLMFGSWIEPTGFGRVFIGVQALAVAALAVLEYAALRRAAHTQVTTRAAMGRSA